MKKYDFIIIGTGMGGATLGYKLAKAGVKVLFLEKGISHIKSQKQIRGEFAETLMFQKKSMNDYSSLHNTGRCTDLIYSNSDKKNFIPFIGKGGGGSSSLYGAVLEQFKPEDFNNELWPISYSDLEPYYQQAESMFEVSRNNLSLSPENIKAWDVLSNNGIHPYELPMALSRANSHLNHQCKDNCQSVLCNHYQKNDAEKIALAPAIVNHQADLIDECEVLELNWKNNKIISVKCIVKNQVTNYFADNFILAAGAIFSPALLLKSKNLANSSGLVGKYLMRHMVDLYSVFIKGSNVSINTQKQIGFNDFYNINGEKFGNVQSFGSLPPSEVILNELIHKLPNFLHKPTEKIAPFLNPFLGSIFKREFKDKLIFASIMEDEPSIENNISVDQKSKKIIMNYKPSEKDTEKVKNFRQMVIKAFAPLKVKLIESAFDNKRLAHVCGTLRFGNNPNKSVLNKNNRSHDIENLYVVDSSFFPTSGGINPSLTIAANSLRVADKILEII